MFGRIGRREAPHFAEFFRRGFDQRHAPAFPVNVEAAICQQHRAGTAFRLPTDLARREIGRDEALLVGTVQIPIEKDLAAQRVWHGSFEVDLFRGDSIPRRG